MSEETAVPSGINPRDDWRDPSNYQPLLKLDRVGWAWEWLRRNPEFVTAMPKSSVHIATGPRVITLADASLAARWGCYFAGSEGAFWSPTVCPSVLALDVEPAMAEGEDAFDARRLAHLTTVLRLPGAEHLLFSNGQRHLQLVVTAGSVLDGPVRFRYALSGFHQIEAKALVLQRLGHLWRQGRLPHNLSPPERRAMRWVLQLRALDGMRAGASHRGIAAGVFSEKIVREDWAGRSDYLRLRIQRLIRGAEKMVCGGYRELLG